MGTRPPKGPPRARSPWHAAAAANRALGYTVYCADCPSRKVLDIVTGKWTSLVIVALERAENGSKRFQQLKREIGGVTQKMLTQTLRALEHDGLVTRQAFATVPPRVEYSLTPLGRSLTEPLAALQDWSEAHVQEIEAARGGAPTRRGGESRIIRRQPSPVSTQ